MFGEMLLHTIGGVYVAQASRHLGKGVKFLDGSKAYWKQKRHIYGTHLTAAKSMLKMYKASKNVKPGEDQKVPESKEMAVFLEGAWNVSVVDVESTLRHITKKVLTDTSVSKQRLARRAEAMLRVGNIFLQAESPESKTDDGKKKTLRESLEAFIGPLSGAAAGGEEEEEEVITHTAKLKKAHGSVGLAVGPDNCVSAVTAGSEAAEAGAAAGDKLVSISVGEAPPVWTAADSTPGSAAAALAAMADGAAVTVALCSAEAAAAAAAARQTQMLPAGTLVTVHGLAAAAHHNGKRGLILGFDGENGRYVVELEDGSTVKLQPKNVTPGEQAPPAERALSRAELEAMGAKGRVEMRATRASLGLGTGAPEVLGPGMRPGSLLPHAGEGA
eukprot:Transcript_990.p1 GENE.Transcript_990~~Transcript_990.p1  ORF type:complete len:387 (+),score=137.87 Transcript_990:1603-2763(+)